MVQQSGGAPQLSDDQGFSQPGRREGIEIFGAQEAKSGRAPDVASQSQEVHHIRQIGQGDRKMITCVLDYVIDVRKIGEFEEFAQRWIELVEQHGGQHHGYFLPAEGASDRALALFSFPSLAAYEQYRSLFGVEQSFIEADRIRDESGCVIRYDRTFMRPFLRSKVAQTD